MKKKTFLLIFLVSGLIAGTAKAMDCPADTAYHIDLRTLLPDGSPNPTYGQLIPTGLCGCVDFNLQLSGTDSTLTLTLLMVDNEPIRGVELDLYHDAGALLSFSDGGYVTKGAKLENVTDENGVPKTMTLLANEIGDHVKVMAYSTSRARTAGDGSEGELLSVTYLLPNGHDALPATVSFGIGLLNLPGTSMDPQLLNVACGYPDTSNMVALDTDYLGLAEAEGLPTSYSLGRNYPNPFNPTTRIGFDLPENIHAKLTIYNLLGQEVVSLVNRTMNAGHYTVEWNGRDWNSQTVASGLYFYELRAGDYVAREKMILLR